MVATFFVAVDVADLEPVEGGVGGRPVDGFRGDSEVVVDCSRGFRNISGVSTSTTSALF